MASPGLLLAGGDSAVGHALGCGIVWERAHEKQLLNDTPTATTT